MNRILKSIFSGNPLFKKPTVKDYLLSLVLTVVLMGLHFYFVLPVISLFTFNFWLLVSIYIIIFICISIFVFKAYSKIYRTLIVVASLIIIAAIGFSIFSSEPINASKYASQMEVKEAKFTDSITSISLSEIPIVDKASAKQLGDKQIGMITGLGSQYNVDPLYTLIIQNEKLYRVSPLEYEDFFKWFQNRGTGIPGYIKVNVNDPSDVKIVELDKGIKYSPKAYFSDNLFRHIRFKYPSFIFGDYSFELDDNDNPYWIIPVLKPEIGMYGGLDSQGVVIVDPHTGETNYYAIGEVPSWVDNVNSISTMWYQIDNWGYYVNGFFNTLFSKKDMIQTTEEYNFVSIDNQLHMFSSLTSVGSDNSIVGFALINVKNKDATFIKVGGADEISAKNSAQGQVQHLNYVATDPILLNIGNVPTYFVGLKDQEGLVKMYSFVSVQDYSIVGVGNTVEEGRLNYLSKLKVSNPDDSVDLSVVEDEVIEITQAIIDGNTNYYIRLAKDNKLFIGSINLSVELPLTKVGDRVKIEYLTSTTNAISITNFDNLNIDFQ